MTLRSRGGTLLRGGTPWPKVAIVYKTNAEGDSVEVGRIHIERGVLIGTPAHQRSVDMILSQAAMRHDTGELVMPTDPERFLLALPAAYTGTMLRVALEDA